MVDGRGVNVSAGGAATLNGSAFLYARHMGYNAQGDETSMSTPPITVTLPGGTTQASTPVTTTYSFDGDGNSSTVTSANGNTIASAYDHLGRLIMATDVSVPLYSGTTGTPVRSLTYDRDGNLMREADANGDVSTWGYDPEQRLVSLTNPVSGTMVMTYSATEKVAAQDERGNVTTYGYDPAGRLIQASDPVSGTIQYQLDPVGNTTTTTASDRWTMTPIQVETQQYDAQNRVLTDTVTGPSGLSLTTAVRYDHDGNVYQVQQPNGDVTINTYDAADQLRTTEIDAATSSGPTHTTQESYSYDTAGNRIESYDFDGRHATLTLDGAGRVIQSVSATTAPTGTTTITTTATYDPDGDTTQKMTQTQNGTGPVQTSTTAAAYNADNWPISTTDNGLTTAYGYDSAGRPRSQTIIDGNTPVTTVLDPGGRATTISENAGGAGPYGTTFGYNALNEVVTMAMPGSVQETAGYDNDGRVTSVSATGPGTGSPATTLNSAYTYSYNALGWITRTTTLSGTDAIVHDVKGRVTDETGPQVVATGGAYHWTYDQNGNMLSQIGDDGAPVTYTYNSSVPNEVQTMVMGDGQPTSYDGYDTNGDTTSITNGARINTHIVYDAAARPIQVAYINRGTPTTATLTYNADGQRARYTVSVANQPTLDERFQYRGGQLGQVTVVTGGVTLYVDTYLYNQDGTPLELLRQQGGTVNRYWYVLDGQDNVVALTDVTGKVVDRYAYDAWGELVTDDGANETVPQQLRYRGYWYDEKLSWYWVSVRYYDPETARWLQPDPSETDGVRTYAYVGDDPIDAADASGLSQDYQQPTSWTVSCTQRDFSSGRVIKACALGGQEPLNVVISARSNFGVPKLGSGDYTNAAGLFEPRLFDFLFDWGSCQIGPVSADPSNLYGNVGDGWRVQNFGYRKGGCGENTQGMLFNPVYGRNLSNHARGWTQQGGATFLALSEEHYCSKDASPQLFHAWHCIDNPNGFDYGRIDFVSNVYDNAYKGYTVALRPQHVHALTSYPGFAGSGPIGIGTDGVVFSDLVDVLTLDDQQCHTTIGRCNR